MITTGSSRSRIRLATARPRTTTPPSAPGTAERAARYLETIQAELPDGGDVGFLVWGDPAFYDSTIRVAEALAGPDFDVDLRVVPGISSLQLLAAAHKIVLNQIGQPVHVTTGRRLLEEYTADLGDVLVMLDGGLACADLVPLHPDLTIYWGAQLGLTDECLMAGRLADVIDDIQRRTRAHPGTPRLGARHLPAAPTLTDPQHQLLGLHVSCSS